MSLQNSLPLTEKYRPSSLREFVGYREVIESILKWLNKWPDVSRRGYLLIGPAGSGKTSLVHALAHDLDFLLVEINASDFRNKDAIQRIVGIASQYQGFSDDHSQTRKMLILIDEVDGISGTHDRGGLAALKKILRVSRVPIFLTANDTESDKIAVIDSLVEKVVFQRPCEPVIYFLLKRISENEGLSLKKTLLRQIAQYSMGDFRGAINDLESVILTEGFDPAFRDQAFTLLEVLQKVFTSSSLVEGREAGRNFSTSDYSTLLAYVNEIVVSHVKDAFLRADLLESIAHADLFLNRTRRTGHWGLLKYFFFDISAKIGFYLSKYGSRVEFSSLEFPARFKYLGQRKRMFESRLRLAKRSQLLFHTSLQKIVHEIFPFLEIIALNDPERGAQIFAWLDFSDEDVVSFLTKKKAQSVLPFMDKARKLVDAERIYHLDTEELSSSSIGLESFWLTSDNTDETSDSVSLKDETNAQSDLVDESDVENDEATDSKGQKTLDDFF